MPGQPLAHLRMLVGRIVVYEGVDHFSHRDLLVDRVEEADELLMARALHVAADDGAVKDVEGCEQRGGAVTFVVVHHRPGTASYLAKAPRTSQLCRNFVVFVISIASIGIAFDAAHHGFIGFVKDSAQEPLRQNR